MARNIRWFISFKSLNGTSCRVNIYDNDWPEGVTMGIRGAADPFFYDENNSSDLLNDVLRYRTGYIKVVENYFGELDAIYPQSTWDRYVEFYYGSHLEFNGYIQTQNFSNRLDFSSSQSQCARVIEFPVISPLGLFDKLTFGAIMPPTTKTLGQLLDMALNGRTYEKVTVPDISGIGLQQTVFSLVVSPWNSNYHHSMNEGVLNKIMEPKTYAFLIESICKAFGWICHDTPQALVFTSFDYKNQYVYYPVGHIGETAYKTAENVTQGPFPLAESYTLADKNATVDTLLPETGIEVSYEGHSGSLNFGFERTYYVNTITMPGASVDDGERWSLCNLLPAPVVNEVTEVGNATFDNNGKVSIGQFVVAWNGHIGVLCSLSGAYNTNQELFRIRLYTKRKTNESWNVVYSGMSSEYSIAALTNDDLIVNGYIKYDRNIYDDYVEVIFKYTFGGTVYPQLPANSLIFIHSIRFEQLQDNLPYSDYRYTPANDNDTMPSLSPHPAISSSITMSISLYRQNDHLIGDTLHTTKLTEYPYMFNKRIELKGKFRAAVSHSPDIFHTRMWTYLDRKWRLIAQSFHPWDDEYELTMQNSPSLSAFPVSTNFENVSSNAPGTADAGSSLVVTLTGVNGNKVQKNSVVVMMGTTDITSMAYDHDTKTVTISYVTGDISITAVGRPYDAEVEWIQTNEKAYINTGVKVAPNLTFIFDIYLTRPNKVVQLFGGRSSSTSNMLYFMHDSRTSGSIGAYWYYGNKSSSMSLLSQGRHVFDNTANAKTLKIDGTSHTASSTSFSATQFDFYIFTIWTGTSPAPGNSPDGAKIYTGKMYSSGTLVRDFIPVRENGVGYLYDKVSGQLFGNANSEGTFTYGNDVI